MICRWCLKETETSEYKTPFEWRKLDLCTVCYPKVRAMAEADEVLESRGFVVFSTYGVRYRTPQFLMNCEEAGCESCTDTECTDCICHSNDFTYPEDVEGLEFVDVGVYYGN